MIVSGGQTGVDRAALDYAIAAELAHGGWCPKGRKAEDGVIPARYALRETESRGYRQRTKLNVLESDATLILNLGALEGGTLETVNTARRSEKAYLIVPLDEVRLADAARVVLWWLQAWQCRVLNVAGPRESKRPGAYQAAWDFLRTLDEIADTTRQPSQT